MSHDFTGKGVIVTGAARGIGRASAEGFAQGGATVIAVDTDAETLDAAVADMEGAVIPVEADVSDPDAVEAMFAQATEHVDRIDIAHNNAGVLGEVAPLTELSPDQWDRVIDVNLRGVWLCLAVELPHMKAHGGGAVVNTSSVAGLTTAGPAPYVASKAGLLGLTRVAAREFGDAGIRVNAVAPGIIDNPLGAPEDEKDPDTVGDTLDHLPAGRMGTTDEVASAVRWLASPDASYITGETLCVDGGYLAR